jgi:hypothetical protein
LARGEKPLPEPAAASGKTVGSVESVQSYTAYDKAADSAYAVNTEVLTDDEIDRLLGVTREQA